MPRPVSLCVLEVEITAEDLAGNAAAPVSRSWNVDVTPPDTTIGDGPDSPAAASEATFEFTGAPGAERFECRLDGNGWAPCGSPWRRQGLANGTHGFEVRAIDAAGNTDPTPAGWVWDVDAAPPPTPPDPGPAGSPTTGGTPGPGPGGTAPTSQPIINFAGLLDRRAPTLRSLSLSTSRLTPGRRIRVRFSATEASTVNLLVARVVAGRRASRRRGAACVRPTRRLIAARNARCTRLESRGNLRRRGRAGLNVLSFGSRLSGRTLEAGRYRLMVSATDAAGNTSSAVRRSFRVLRP